MNERIEVKSPDAFENNPKLNEFFTMIVDYLSLWHWMYGLHYGDIRINAINWVSHNIISFKAWNAFDGRAISMRRYDPRLPDLPGVHKGRIYRMQDFIRSNPWFRRLMLDAEHHINDWAATYEVPGNMMDVTTRWTDDGLVVIKLIDKRKPITADTYMMHKRYE